MVAVSMQWSMPQNRPFGVMWEVMDDAATVHSGSGVDDTALCVKPGKDHTLIAVDPLEEGA